MFPSSRCLFSLSRVFHGAEVFNFNGIQLISHFFHAFRVVAQKGITRPEKRTLVSWQVDVGLALVGGAVLWGQGRLPSCSSGFPVLLRHKNVPLVGFVVFLFFNQLNFVSIFIITFLLFSFWCSLLLLS